MLTFTLQNGLLSSIPYIAQWVTSILASILADRLISKRIMTVTAVRKSYAIIGEINQITFITMRGTDK
jgi:MFS transporter, ACS family, solute carrier family 17 (sodium-dependent inorganic phosphate cotransporter), other